MAKRKASGASPRTRRSRATKKTRKKRSSRAARAGVSSRAMTRARSVKKVVLRHIGAAQGSYYARIARAIEDSLECRITIRPTRQKQIRGSGEARTYSRLVKNEVEWPEPRRFAVWEHWIFWDNSLPPEQAALAIGHELGHILLHLRRHPDRRLDRDGRADFSEGEEWEAGLFSLYLLRYQQAVRRPHERWLSKSSLVSILKEYAQRVGEMESSSLLGDIPAVKAMIDEGMFD